MRGGRSTPLAVYFYLLVAGCSAPPTPTPPAPSNPLLLFRPTADVPSPPSAASADERATAPGVVAAKTEPARREAGFEELLKLQKEIAARNPASDDEKLRLAMLHATAGNLEEAERILSTVRSRTNKFLPYLDLLLRRELGEHREAGKLVALLNEEDRRATGFLIDRALLCTQVRRFRDYVPAEGDRVKPGGMILLYVEPRNFALQRDQGRYILHLKYEWKLLDDRSAEVPVPAWEQASLEEREDRVSLNGPVTEFYQSFKLPLPAGLPAGQYRVRVTVTDASSGKNDRADVPLTVAGPEVRR